VVTLARRKKSRRKQTQNAKLRKALKVPNKQKQDYSLLLLIVVAVVAVIAIVMSQPAALPVGEAYNVPSNMCDQYCPSDQHGIPIGAHGRIQFCKCANRM